MPYYVTLGNWTDQGIRNVKDVPKRVESTKAVVEQHGGKVLNAFVTMGKYDFVFISELPSDEAMMEVALAIGMKGNGRTTTLKAWTPQDAAKVIAKLP
jgi:uncharacterized protein with GYD domain